MSRNRRNKRSIKKITDLISFKTFVISSIVLISIILACIFIIMYRNEQDRILLAKQWQELDEKVESIFSEMVQRIERAQGGCLGTKSR